MQRKRVSRARAVVALGSGLIAKGTTFLLFAAQAHAATSVPLTIVTTEGQQQVEVEVAATPRQREHGLMMRTELAADHGMLFSYSGAEQPASNGYWMYRTLIPLDIAFIARDGTIVSTSTMAPCTASESRECPIFYPAAPYVAALEMPGGYFARHHIGAGDRVLLPHK